jgi:hypothetical protein
VAPGDHAALALTARLVTTTRGAAAVRTGAGARLAERALALGEENSDQRRRQWRADRQTVEIHAGLLAGRALRPVHHPALAPVPRLISLVRTDPRGPWLPRTRSAHVIPPHRTAP